MSYIDPLTNHNLLNLKQSTHWETIPALGIKSIVGVWGSLHAYELHEKNIGQNFYTLCQRTPTSVSSRLYKPSEVKTNFSLGMFASSKAL